MRIQFKDVGLIVFRLRVIDLVHGNRIRIVIAGNVRADSHGVVHCRGHATATREKVNNNLVVKIKDVLRAFSLGSHLASTRIRVVLRSSIKFCVIAASSLR